MQFFRCNKEFKIILKNFELKKEERGKKLVKMLRPSALFSSTRLAYFTASCLLNMLVVTRPRESASFCPQSQSNKALCNAASDLTD